MLGSVDRPWSMCTQWIWDLHWPEVLLEAIHLRLQQLWTTAVVQTLADLLKIGIVVKYEFENVFLKGLLTQNLQCNSFVDAPL